MILLVAVICHFKIFNNVFQYFGLTWSSFLTTCLSRKGNKCQMLLLKGHNNWMSQPWIYNTNARDQRVIRGGIARSCKVVSVHQQVKV